jgi:transmembrane sensor
MDPMREYETGAPADIEARAADWLVRRRDGADWREADQLALDAWLAESSAHLMAYWRLETAWSRADRLNALPKQASANGLPARGRRLFPRLARTAAVLALVGGALAGARYFLPRDNTVTYQTGIGGHRIVALADGSKIELNTDTALRVSGDARQQNVALEKGEAYFQIRHNPSRQFVVVAGAQRIVDLGTKFVVRDDVNRVRVSLVEGSARLEPLNDSATARPVLLRPGDVAIATERGVSLSRQPQAMMVSALSWRRDLLIFNNTPLAQVAEEFNRYNKRKLVVMGDDARSIGVGGNFQADNVAVFARVAQGVLGLHVESHSGEIVISR